MGINVSVDIDPNWEEDQRAANEHEALVWLMERNNERIITLPPDWFNEEDEVID